MADLKLGYVGGAKVGDKVTFAGCFREDRNPNWRWWAFWRPRRIASSELQAFVVTQTHSSNWMRLNDQ